MNAIGLDMTRPTLVKQMRALHGPSERRALAKLRMRISQWIYQGSISGWHITAVLARQLKSSAGFLRFI
jgi:hypothetical protein